MQMDNRQYYLPAEWHNQVGVQLTWPHKNTDWAPYLEDIVTMETEMAKQIARREMLVIAAPEATAVRNYLQTQLSEDEMSRVVVCSVETNDTWARDHGAITLLPFNSKVNDDANEIATDKDADNPFDATSNSQLALPLLLDFKFNGWGEKFESAKDNMITRTLFDDGTFSQLWNDGSLYHQDNDDFVLEGGAIESDGKGTVFTTSFCLLAAHRNQPLSKLEIEEQLKLRLGCERVVWIDHGRLIGDDTDGHIDTIVRVCPNDTLVYVKCYDEADEQYADFCELEKQLKALRTTDGKPYRLLPVPMPEAMFDEEDRLPATYANFLIINDAVLVPTYGQPELDQQAVSAIAEAFPGRDVIGIDARVAVRQHGSLHCLTMQFPEIN